MKRYIAIAALTLSLAACGTEANGPVTATGPVQEVTAAPAPTASETSAPVETPVAEEEESDLDENTDAPVFVQSEDSENIAYLDYLTALDSETGSTSRSSESDERLVSLGRDLCVSLRAGVDANDALLDVYSNMTGTSGYNVGAIGTAATSVYCPETL